MILSRRDGPVLTIAFDRASARNAIDGEGWDRLSDKIERAAASDAAVVVLASAVPGVFSAGADLTMVAGLHEDAGGRVLFRERMARATEGLAALPMPVVAAVDGPCYGAAVALVLACDLIVAGRAARFAITPAKLGIGYPGGDVARLVARVGRGGAARLLFTADPVSADEAVGIGLVDVIAEDATATAGDLARRMAGNSHGALRLLKATLADPAGSDAAFDAAFAGRDFADRIAAFRNRPR